MGFLSPGGGYLMDFSAVRFQKNNIGYGVQMGYGWSEYIDTNSGSYDDYSIFFIGALAQYAFGDVALRRGLILSLGLGYKSASIDVDYNQVVTGEADFSGMYIYGDVSYRFGGMLLKAGFFYGVGGEETFMVTGPYNYGDPNTTRSVDNPNVGLSPFVGLSWAF